MSFFYSILKPVLRKASAGRAVMTRENTLANNLDMFLLFLSFYEASDHRMAGEAIDEIIGPGLK